MRSQRAHTTRSLAVAAAFLAAGFMGGAHAQGTSISLQDLGLSEAQSRALIDALHAPAAAPGISFGSPVGFGADWGELGVGLGGQTLPSNAPTTVDGSMSVTFGLGNADKYFGLETTVNIISLRKSFGEDGAVGLKGHVNLPHRSAIGFGVQNVGRWGSAEGGKSSAYGVYTQFFDTRPSNARNPMPIALNIGLGDNTFSGVSRRKGVDVPDGGLGVFGGIAFFPMRQLSLIADWTGRSLNLGVSLVPFRSVPFVATVGALNVTGNYQGRQFGDDIEFGAGIGYNFRF